MPELSHIDPRSAMSLLIPAQEFAFGLEPVRPVVSVLAITLFPKRVCSL